MRVFQSQEMNRSTPSLVAASLEPCLHEIAFCQLHRLDRNELTLLTAVLLDVGSYESYFEQAFYSSASMVGFGPITSG